MGIASGVTIYRTRLMHRFVIGLGAPSGKRAAYALAAVARRRNLAADAYAEHVDQWEAVGNAPFHAQRIQGPVSANRIVE
jgi:hypothetical protein